MPSRPMLCFLRSVFIFSTQFIHQVREDWQGRELELVSYQGRIQLVKGWDALFSRLEEHLNGLQSMRASPHFHAVQVFVKNI